MVRALLPVVLLISAAALAGCSGGDGPTEALQELRPMITDDTGAIQGVVTDDQLAPVASALVAVLETGNQTQTHENGRFVFNGLAPGSYQVVVQKLGYHSAAKRVSVTAGQTSEMSFELPTIAISEPWTELLGPFEGYFECRLGTPVLTGACGAVNLPNDRGSFGFKSHDDTNAIIGETRWQQGSAATSQSLRTSFSYEGRTNSHWFCSVTGSSPTQWKYLLDGDRGECISYGGNTQQLPGSEPRVPSSDLDLITYVNTPFGGTSTSNPPAHLALQQRFSVMVALFQNGVPADGYSPWPDA